MALSDRITFAQGKDKGIPFKGDSGALISEKQIRSKDPIIKVVHNIKPESRMFGTQQRYWEVIPESGTDQNLYEFYQYVDKAGNNALQLCYMTKLFEREPFILTSNLLPPSEGLLPVIFIAQEEDIEDKDKVLCFIPNIPEDVVKRYNGTINLADFIDKYIVDNSIKVADVVVVAENTPDDKPPSYLKGLPYITAASMTDAKSNCGMPCFSFLEYNRSRGFAKQDKVKKDLRNAGVTSNNLGSKIMIETDLLPFETKDLTEQCSTLDNDLPAAPKILTDEERLEIHLQNSINELADLWKSIEKVEFGPGIDFLYDPANFYALYAIAQLDQSITSDLYYSSHVYKDISKIFVQCLIQNNHQDGDAGIAKARSVLTNLLGELEKYYVSKFDSLQEYERRNMLSLIKRVESTRSNIRSAKSSDIALVEKSGKRIEEFFTQVHDNIEDLKQTLQSEVVLLRRGEIKSKELYGKLALKYAKVPSVMQFTEVFVGVLKSILEHTDNLLYPEADKFFIGKFGSKEHEIQDHIIEGSDYEYAPYDRMKGCNTKDSALPQDNERLLDLQDVKNDTLCVQCDPHTTYRLVFPKKQDFSDLFIYDSNNTINIFYLGESGLKKVELDYSNLGDAPGVIAQDNEQNLITVCKNGSYSVGKLDHYRTIPPTISPSTALQLNSATDMEQGQFSTSYLNNSFVALGNSSGIQSPSQGQPEDSTSTKLLGGLLGGGASILALISCIACAYYCWFKGRRGDSDNASSSVRYNRRSLLRDESSVYAPTTCSSTESMKVTPRSEDEFCEIVDDDSSSIHGLAITSFPEELSLR